MLKATTIYLDVEYCNICITGKLHVQTHDDATEGIFVKLTVTARCILYANFPMNSRQTQHFITKNPATSTSFGSYKPTCIIHNRTQT